MTYGKPLPTIEDWTRGYWEAAKRHELVIQRCQKCGALRHYPRPMCPKCNSMKYDWTKVSGKGKIYSWTAVRHVFHSAFTEIPYVLAIIELDDAHNLRLISNIVDCSSEYLYVGMPVEVIFDDVTDEITLPKFRPVK